MKMMKKVGMVLALVGMMMGVSACSKGDLPQQYDPSQDVTASVETTEKKAETETADQPTAPAVEEKKEGPVLVMTTARADQQIEGSDGLGFFGVYAEGEEETAITEAIGKGHFFATTAEDGPVIKVTAQESMMGDTVSFKEGMKLKVDIKGIKSGSIVKVTDGTNTIFEEKIMGDKTTQRVEVKAKGAYKVEVCAADGTLLAVSNPMNVGE